MAAILAARETGATQIIAIGLNQDSHRFEVARRFGATHFINLQVEDPVQRIHQLTGGALSRCGDRHHWRHQLRATITGACASYGYGRIGFKYGRSIGSAGNQQDRR